jgi:ribosomal protein L7/L12
MLDALSNNDREQIATELAAGRKIEAIKLYRTATGAGLAEAKQAVEAMEAGRPFESRQRDSVGNDDVDAIQGALFTGRKIQAIKLYRESTGMGLKESKDFIDALEVELRRTDPTRFTAPAAKGCFTVVLVLFILCGCVTSVLFAAGLGKH